MPYFACAVTVIVPPVDEGAADAAALAPVPAPGVLTVAGIGASVLWFWSVLRKHGLQLRFAAT